MIEAFEDLVEIPAVPLRRQDAFAPARLPDVLRLPRDGLRRDVPAVSIGVRSSDLFLVELCQQNMRNRAMHTLRSRFEQVRKANEQFSLAKVVFSEVKRRNRMSSDGIGARGRSSRYSSSKISVREGVKPYPA